MLLLGLTPLPEHKVCPPVGNMTELKWDARTVNQELFAFLYHSGAVSNTLKISSEGFKSKFSFSPLPIPSKAQYKQNIHIVSNNKVSQKIVLLGWWTDGIQEAHKKQGKPDEFNRCWTN